MRLRSNTVVSHTARHRLISHTGGCLRFAYTQRAVTQADQPTSMSWPHTHSSTPTRIIITHTASSLISHTAGVEQHINI